MPAGNFTGQDNCLIQGAPEKTRVVHIDEGFDFLSFTIRRQQKRGTQKHYVYTKPSKRAIQVVKDKVKAKTNRATRHLSLTEVLVSLNRMLRGWANYFRHGVSKQTFGAIDNHAWHCITKWIFHKYSRLRLGNNCAAGSAYRAPGPSRMTGPNSPAHPAPRWSASAEARSRPHGHRDRQPPSLAVDRRARHVERPVRGDTHAGCGERARETHREQSRQSRAPVRPNPAATS